MVFDADNGWDFIRANSGESKRRMPFITPAAYWPSGSPAEASSGEWPQQPWGAIALSHFVLCNHWFSRSICEATTSPSWRPSAASFRHLSTRRPTRSPPVPLKSPNETIALRRDRGESSHTQVGDASAERDLSKAGALRKAALQGL
jgi:hypothetical protein